MSDRVVVQSSCLNGRFHQEIEERLSCCDHWPDGDRSHGEFGLCPTSSFCDGSPTRVLEPGSYVLVEKVDGEWPAVSLNHELFVGPLLLQVMADALAGADHG